MILNYITWDVHPEIFTIGSFSIRWYGFLFAHSFISGYFIMKRISLQENLGIKLLDQLSTYMILATIIGARLGHCLFYEPEVYLSNPIEILYVWEGGLASHGAAIGILLALFFFSRKNQKPYLWILDRIVIVVALAGFFIRMGNLMNSEIYGVPSQLPWSFIFVNAPNFQEADDPRHPTQIYEALSYLLIFIYLLYTYFHKNGKPKPGYLFAMFLILVFSARFVIEFSKEPQVAFEYGMTLNMGQLLSLPFIVTGLLILYFKRKQ